MPTYVQRTRESRGVPAALAGEAFTRGIGSARKGYSDKIADFIRERYQNLDYFTHIERFARLPAVNADQTGDNLTVTVEYLAASVDKRFFTAPQACIVTSVQCVPTVIGSDGGAVTAVVEKLDDAEALTNGDDVTTGTFDLKGTADTVQTGTLGTAAIRTMSVGETLAVDFTGTLTAATGVITVEITLIDGAGLPRAAHPDLELLGTNASDADVTFLEGGGIRLETDGADADQEIIAAHLDASQSYLAGANWDSRNEILFGTNIVTGPQAADIHFSTIWAGFKLTNTDIVATDDDQFFFRAGSAAASAANWTAVQSIAGTDVEYDTGITLVEATPYQLLVVLDENRVPHYYINSAKVWTGTGQVAADNDYEFYTGIAARGEAAAKQLDIRNFVVSQLYG